MKCRKINRLIPLYAGSDLPAKARETVQRHLQDCPNCQKAHKEYQIILQQTRDWLVKERTDWGEAEWEKTVQTAIEKAEKKKHWLVPWPFKKSWAFAFMIASTVLFSLFVLHPSFVKDNLDRVPTFAVMDSQPEIVSMKFVSKETGLKINWFFHKDLKLEVME